ncbi:FxsA family protein [Sulfurivirga sp.]|uniref:FxsA family protein n=1 Tax=Sulfurivirga sp. TaxID=2614236 RepID=UPI0025D18D89|nr:FxsA family protein [Sulfurivirga sp.]
MFRWIFLALLLVPAVELFFLIQVGSVIGALPTIALVLLTALVGAWLMRQQGLMTLQRLQVQLAQGMVPEQAMLEGALILLGGMLLLIPGFITDALGLALLLPGVRHRLAARWLRTARARGAANDAVIVEGEVVWRRDTEGLPPEASRHE